MKIQTLIFSLLISASFSAIAQVPRATISMYVGDVNVNSSTPKGKAILLNEMSKSPIDRSLMNFEKAGLAKPEYAKAVAILRNNVALEIGKTKFFKANTIEIQRLTDLRLSLYLMSSTTTRMLCQEFETGLANIKSYGDSMCSQNGEELSRSHLAGLARLQNEMIKYVHRRESALIELDQQAQFRKTKLSEFSELQINDSDRAIQKDDKSPSNKPVYTGKQALEA